MLRYVLLLRSKRNLDIFELAEGVMRESGGDWSFMALDMFAIEFSTEDEPKRD